MQTFTKCKQLTSIVIMPLSDTACSVDVKMYWDQSSFSSVGGGMATIFTGPFGSFFRVCSVSATDLSGTLLIDNK